MRSSRRVEAERDPALDRQQCDVGAFGGDRDCAAAIDQQAELRRQGAQPFVGGKAFGDRARDGSDVEPLDGIQPRQRRDHEIARRFGLGIGVDQAEPAESRVQLGQAFLDKAAELQVGAPREVDMAVAQSPGEIGQAARLIQAEGAAERPDAHDQPVAALHRPQGARAPAFHLDGCGRAHDPAFIIARSSS